MPFTTKKSDSTNDDQILLLAQQLMALFPSSQRSFAIWDPASLDPDDRGKLVPKYSTINRPIAVDDWIGHLRGQRMVVVPLGCDDGTTKVSIIDVDYDVDWSVLKSKIKLLGLPLYLSRSKSGHPHITSFYDVPIAVESSERVGREIARRLRLRDAIEIFPRPQHPEMKPLDVNMPYPGGERGYLRRDGDTLDELALSEFLETTELMTAVQRVELLKTAPAADHTSGQAFAERMLTRFKDRLANEGQGNRNKFIYWVARYLASMVARDWIEEQRVEDELMAVADAAGWDNRRKTKQTIQNGIKRGLQEPHADLADPWRWEVVADYNARYAVVNFEGKFCIVEITARGRRPTFYKNNDFLLLHAAECAFVTDKDGKVHRHEKAKVWLGHSQRRQYTGVEFRPGDDGDGDTFNIWTGWAVDPVPGDCSGWLELVREVVCGGNLDDFNWVLHWFANIVREPMNRAQTTLGLKGIEGAGKNLMLSYFGKILGDGFLLVSDAEHIHGKFNKHLANTLLLHSAEALFPGEKKHQSIIKSLITDDTFMLQPKGIDAAPVANHLRLALSGNDDRIAAISRTDRRHTVLDLEERKISEEVLDRVLAERNGGGPAALLHYLLTMEYDPKLARTTIRNEARLEQQDFSLSPLDAWLWALLNDGVLPGLPDFDNTAVTTWLFAEAQRKSPELRRIHINTFIAHFRKRLGRPRGGTGPTFENWRDEDKRGWTFPPLSVCRERWDQYRGFSEDWPEQADWEVCVVPEFSL